MLSYPCASCGLKFGSICYYGWFLSLGANTDCKVNQVRLLLYIVIVNYSKCLCCWLNNQSLYLILHTISCVFFTCALHVHRSSLLSSVQSCTHSSSDGNRLEKLRKGRPASVAEQWKICPYLSCANGCGSFKLEIHPLILPLFTELI